MRAHEQLRRPAERDRIRGGTAEAPDRPSSTPPPARLVSPEPIDASTAELPVRADDVFVRRHEQAQDLLLVGGDGEVSPQEDDVDPEGQPSLLLQPLGGEEVPHAGDEVAP